MNTKSSEYNPTVYPSEFSKVPHENFVQEKGIDLLTYVSSRVLFRTPHNMNDRKEVVKYAFDLSEDFLEERAKRLGIKKEEDGS